jgi:hypothetical protein
MNFSGIPGSIFRMPNKGKKFSAPYSVRLSRNRKEYMKNSIDFRKFRMTAYALMLISGLYVVFTVAWILSGNRTIITIMEILTVGAALTIIQFMEYLYHSSSENKKSEGLLALIFSVCMAAVTIMNHFIYITVLNQIYIGKDMPSWLLLDGWPSISKGLECVSWGCFLGLAMLFASSVLEEWGSKVITWTMRIGGILALAGLAGPITGNMNYYLLSTIGYSAGFLIISIEMAVCFRRDKTARGNGLPAENIR